MVMPDRLLLGPGPSNPYPEVTAAFAQPLLGHLDPEFLRILDETCDRLRTVFGTTNALTLPISGTGSAGMEACFVNLRRAGRHRDHRGQRRVRRAHVRGRAPRAAPRSCGSTPRGARPIDPQRAARRARRAPGRPRARGRARGDVDRGRERHRAAARASRTPTRCCSSTRSRRSAASRSTSTGGGSTPATRARRSASACRRGSRRSRSRPARSSGSAAGPTPAQSWYLDLGLIGDYVGDARKYHHTAPTAMIVALHAGLGVVLDEGLDASWARHRGGRAQRSRTRCRSSGSR